MNEEKLKQLLKELLVEIKQGETPMKNYWLQRSNWNQTSMPC